MYKVYILRSLKDSKTYTGFTQNIKIRLQEHSLGKVVATRNRRPFKLLYTEDALTLQEAKKREKFWKSGGGRRKLKNYFSRGFPPITNDGRGSPK